MARSAEPWWLDYDITHLCNVLSEMCLAVRVWSHPLPYTTSDITDTILVCHNINGYNQFLVLKKAVISYMGIRKFIYVWYWDNFSLCTNLLSINFMQFEICNKDENFWNYHFLTSAYLCVQQNLKYFLRCSGLQYLSSLR